MAHPYGFWSLIPPIMAIGLALLTRRIYSSLLLGVLVGAMIVANGRPLVTLQIAVVELLWNQLTSVDNLYVFAFTLLMGAMVGLIGRAGGMQGLIDKLSPFARGRRSGQITTWALGLLIFFDDYANTLLLGGTMQPLTDRLKISREKLAYLVDSTAAPIAGLAIISTWVATEIKFIDQALEATGSAGEGFAVFVESIPFRFYVLFALALVFFIAVFGRDFGPMLKAERSFTSDGRPTAGAAKKGSVAANSDLPHRWYNALLPVAVVVAVTVYMLLRTGSQSLDSPSATWTEKFIEGDSYVALLYGSLAGLLTAVVLVAVQRLLAAKSTAIASFSGAWQMVPALVVLWLAKSLAQVTSTDDIEGTKLAYLQTGDYLGGLLEGVVIAQLMPTLVFVLAAVVAFATGTSWGTMGILMPLAVSSTFNLLEATAADPSSEHPILLGSVAGVLAGAIFGDHCSPISDTTILSSRASGCPHIAHVRTQLPYALLAAGVAIIFGTLPVGFGVSPWPCLFVGVVVLAGLVRWLGRSAA